MPVVSPSRYNATSTSLSGSYRSTLTSTTVEKPYFRSSSSNYDTIRSYERSEYRTRYSDIDTNRDRKTSLAERSRTSRAPSITDSDSGISSRYRSERSESRSRDISTTRSESSKTTSDPLPRSRRSVITSADLAMSAAELYNKYSPANYIPLTQRIQQQQQQQNQNYSEISRSKSISNDIGRPPAADPARLARKARNSAATISERPERRSYKESSPGHKRGMVNGVKDTNGNEVPSVSEMRKRFDSKMTVTKLPANDTRYSKTSVEHYLNQLKDCENGTVGYTKLVPKDEKIVPVHLPHEKNGLRWEIGSTSSRSNSNSDLSLSKTTSEPVSIAKSNDKTNAMSTSLTSKLPSERLASIKSQLDPNNPIGKILEKSTVIQVENGDADFKKHDGQKFRELKNDIEKQVKAPKHTSNFASYIQISQPVSSGATSKKQVELNNVINEEPSRNHVKTEPRRSRVNLKYIDSEDDRLLLDNDIESPSGTGFENKTFEHENYLKKRTEKSEDDDRRDEEVKSMETSTESTLSEPTEDLSPDTPSSRRKALDKDYEDTKGELAGGKSGPSGLRRSTDRSDSICESRPEKQSSHTSGLNGLRNIGNTCFMNSVLQCLSNTRALLEYVTEEKFGDDINTTLSCMKGALIKAFASVIKELWRTGERDSVVNTTSLKSQVQRFAPRFMGYSQQDAQEFLRYLLEGLHEDVNRVTIKPKPILTEIDDSLSDSAKATEAWSRYLRMEDSRVGDIFMGQLKSTLRCTHCNHDSVTFDPFWDLSLPIPCRTGNLKLQQCLQHFTREEELDGDEKPTCSKCGVRRKCLKWFTVQKFPQVLVLHLKRFSPTERFRGKLNVLVEFPLNGLDMSPYAATRGNSPVYNLYAVSNHSGTTYSGHYTAYCKHPYNGEWHEYNDSRQAHGPPHGKWFRGLWMCATPGESHSCCRPCNTESFCAISVEDKAGQAFGLPTDSTKTLQVSQINGRNVVSSEAYVLFYELAGPRHT